MSASLLFERIREKRTFLCVGLDPDLSKFPEIVLESDDPVYEFNKRIVDATHDMVVAYKPNIAFYEALGSSGWWSLEKTVEYIHARHPEIIVIADAKRGDIGNTSGKYAEAFFNYLNFDAITVAPYMGEDSVKPFLDFKAKWTILLAVTSNKGASDFQFTGEETGESLFEKVLEKASGWGTVDNLMFVAGATRPDMISRVRTIVPDHFLLVPGIGAQGGSLADVVANGMNSKCGLLVNSSRAILYADDSENFAVTATHKARLIQEEMAEHLRERGLL